MEGVLGLFSLGDRRVYPFGSSLVFQLQYVEEWGQVLVWWAVSIHWQSEGMCGCLCLSAALGVFICPSPTCTRACWVSEGVWVVAPSLLIPTSPSRANYGFGLSGPRPGLGSCLIRKKGFVSVQFPGPICRAPAAGSSSSRPPFQLSQPNPTEQPWLHFLAGSSALFSCSYLN